MLLLSRAGDTESLCHFVVFDVVEKMLEACSNKSTSAKGPLIEHLLVFRAFLASFVFFIRGGRGKKEEEEEKEEEEKEEEGEEEEKEDE